MAEEFTPLPTPLTPPLTEEDKLSWLRLLRSRRVGIATFFRLMAEHGSARAALEALPDVAKAAGVANYEACSREFAEKEFAAARAAGAHFVAMGTPDYPVSLTDIPEAPPFFWAVGNVSLLNRPQIAMVGARNASSLGTRMARRLAGELGQSGEVIVSGLARGIDTAAHIASLDTGTIAVMAGGVDVIYPSENAVLAQEIAENGLLISEAHMHLRPQARHFPRRNRLISGLSRAVIVVESAAKSGSLITAQAALDQGRDVLAVPGHPFDARAAGCNMLIRDGAALIRGTKDVHEALGAPQTKAAPAHPDDLPRSKPNPANILKDTARLHRDILDRLGPSPVAEDQLIRDLALPAGQVAPELVTLELDGKILRQAGGLIARA